MSPLGRARDKQCASKGRSTRGAKGGNNGGDGEVAEVSTIARCLRSGRRQLTNGNTALKEGIESDSGDLLAQQYQTRLETETELPEPHDLVYRLRIAKQPEKMDQMTLFKADGVGCVVEAPDIITIADGQCVTDAIVDFHNVLLSIRQPTTPNDTSWAAVDSKAFTYVNTFGKPYSIGNASRVFDVDFLAIPVFKSLGSKGGSAASVALDGAGSGTVELRVFHPSPCALPVPAAPRWSINDTAGSMLATHQAEPAVVHADGARPVVLAMPAKRKRDDPQASRADAEGGAPACKSKGKGQGHSLQYKGVRKEKRGRWSAKILFREKNKKKRTQMRLGAYNKELEAATAYAAAVHVVKDGKCVLGTVELTDEEKGMLEGCTLSAVKRLVRGRQWFRWTEWETTLVECPEEETAGDGEEHSDSQDDDAGDAAGCAVEEGDEEIELEGEGLGDAEGTAGQGTPHELNEDAAAAMGGVASAAQGASQVSPNAGVASSVGAGNEEVGSDGEGEAAPVISKAVASVMAKETSAAKGKAATAPPKPVPDNPFAAMSCGSAQPASGSRREEAVADDVFVISRAELEALKTVRDDGERRIARLEALLLVANDPKTQNKRPRGPRGERAHGDARPSKRRRRESGSEDATSEEGKKDDAEVEPVRARRVVRRRHMTVSSSPILQEAFDFMPSGKAWKRKARLSNSAGGNAEVVNGLHQVAERAVAQAIQDFKPKYDADAEAWVWGEHGLMLSSCGLEHLIPGRYAQRAPVVEEGGSVSRGSD
ncbi:unnamed protein product [Closterium sp. NIES-65]|nr:unnamed protein product [Closterium sp. NIES-65]